MYYNAYSQLDFSDMFCQCKIMSCPKSGLYLLLRRVLALLRNTPSSHTATCLRQINLKMSYNPYPEMFIRKQGNKNLNKIFESPWHRISRMNQLGRGVRFTRMTHKQILKQTALVGKHRCLCTISFGPETTFQTATVRLGKLELAAPCE